jgi:hypothetical protein
MRKVRTRNDGYESAAANQGPFTDPKVGGGVGAQHGGFTTVYGQTPAPEGMVSGVGQPQE